MPSGTPLIGTMITCPLCKRPGVKIVESDTNYSGAELEDHSWPFFSCGVLLLRCPMAWSPVSPREADNG